MAFTDNELENARLNAGKLHARGQIARLFSEASTMTLSLHMPIESAIHDAMGACVEAARLEQVPAARLAKILRDAADEIEAEG